MCFLSVIYHNITSRTNLLIVFFVTGLWHGASWNFIVWGLFHGFFLLLERTKLGIWREKVWFPLQYLYTVLVVLIGWVFFRLETLAQAQSFLKVMFGLSMTDNYPFDYFDFLNQKVLVCLTFAIGLSMPFPKLKFLGNYQIIPLLRRSLVTIILVGILLLSIADLASDTYNPFIYFRF
jgi:alginate O-acetyltransferase complex protein AlgI